MKVGDLVRHGSSVDRGDNPVGVITYLWPDYEVSYVSILFEDGEYDVDRDDLEMINEDR